MVRERLRDGFPGIPVLLLILAGGVGLFANIVRLIGERAFPGLIAFSIIGSVLLMIFMLAGFFIVNPNEGRVLQLFGKYVGTVRRRACAGQPVLHARSASRCACATSRARKLKVNDNGRQPDRDRRGGRVAGRRYRRGRLQGRRLRELRARAERVGAAQRGHQLSLRLARRGRRDLAARHTAAVAEHLKEEMQERLPKAGVEVIEARISHLAYAPEIAAAMLQRQQAGAIIAARTRIVEGAVGMVEMALDVARRSAASCTSTRSARRRW